MLTPGSLRAEAISACFMEAGFTSSLFRTVLEEVEKEERLVRFVSAGDECLCCS